MPAPRLHEIKAANEDRWLAIDGVEGVGVGANSIIIDISKPADEITGVPRKVDDVEIEFRETGVFGVEPLADAEDIDAQPQRSSRYRPIIGGVSIGHEDITAGTSGFVAEDPDTGERYLLSNNHVLANTDAGETGDPVLQPAPMHNGRQVGTLEGAVPIDDGVTVDVAWARTDDDVGLDPRMKGVDTPEDPVSVRSPDPGDTLRKSGITTGVTTGTVEQIDSSVNVRFSNGETVRFTQCIITENMSDAGDSGSAVVDADGNPVGLMFAGSDKYSILCAADNIEEQTGLEIVYGPQEDDEEEEDEGNLNPEGRVEITVLDESEEPLSGATVTADTDEAIEKTADSRGQVYFSTDVEPVDVTVEANGYQPVELTVAEDDFE